MNGQSIDWQRVARTGLRFALRGTGWLLTAAARLMQNCGNRLQAFSERFSEARQSGQAE